MNELDKVKERNKLMNQLETKR